MSEAAGISRRKHPVFQSFMIENLRVNLQYVGLWVIYIAFTPSEQDQVRVWSRLFSFLHAERKIITARKDGQLAIYACSFESTAIAEIFLKNFSKEQGFTFSKISS